MSKKPLSSRKARWAPSRRAFFYIRPVVALPVGYGNLVPLHGPPFRHLTRPTVSAKQSPYVIGVIVYPELPLDHLGDATQGPQFVGIPTGNGPCQQQFQQLPTLILRQFGRTPGHGPGRQRLGPALGQRLLPTTDGGFRTADAMGHFRHRQSTLQQFDRLPPPVLQRLRRTMGSHAS